MDNRTLASLVEAESQAKSRVLVGAVRHSVDIGQMEEKLLLYKNKGEFFGSNVVCVAFVILFCLFICFFYCFLCLFFFFSYSLDNVK